MEKKADAEAASFQQCVQLKIPHLSKANPNRPHNQNVAIAYQECKAKFDAIDSVLLQNQIIATEGVLDYNSQKLLKMWDDLKKFDGITVPIVNEHPPRDNGMQGMVSGKERVYGTAKIHACIKELPILCMDATLDNDSPLKNGYSIGFEFDLEAKCGTHKGEKYDAIQHITAIDHVALTNYPRNEIALNDVAINQSTQNLAILADSTIVKKNFGYDQSKSFKFSTNSGSDVKTMAEPTVAELQKEIETLKAENQKLKSSASSKDAQDSDSKVIELRKQKEQFESDAKKWEAAYSKLQGELVKKAVDSLIDEFGIEAKEFDGKTKEFIDGASFLSNFIKNMPDESIKSITPAKDSKDASKSPKSVNDFAYDSVTGKMIKR